MNYILITNIFFCILQNNYLEICIYQTNIYNMRYKISKTKRSKDALVSKSKETKKIISEEAIRTRAFDIYLENTNSSSTEQDNWFYAERELNGYYK